MKTKGPRTPARRRKPSKPRSTATEKQQAVRFKKGSSGNPKRGPNKLTRDLKEGIVDAAIRHGEDGKGKAGLEGYLFMLAKKHPKQYTSLLARVMPLQITGNVGAFIGSVNIVSVPVDRYLTAEDMKRLNPPADEIVDAEYAETKDEDAA
jgi:hypothetical protein